MSAAAELVARAFAVRTASHIAHLKSRHYAEHIALGDFYPALVDLVDTFAEVHQGLFGLLGAYPGAPTPTTAPLEFLVDFVDWVRSMRGALSQGEPALENVLDDITTLTAQTIYKLRFLS